MNPTTQCTPTHQPTFTPPSHTTPNPAWGDRMPLLTKTDRSSTLRIAFQNARGIYCNQNWSTWTNACQFIKSNNIGILGSVETNLHWTPERIHELTSLTTCHLLTPKVITSSCSTHPSSRAFQPGGTLLLSTSRWS